MVNRNSAEPRRRTAAKSTRIGAVGLLFVLLIASLSAPRFALAQGAQVSSLGDMPTVEEKRQKIADALNSNCSFDFKESTMQSVAVAIADAFDIKVALDVLAMDAVGLGKDTPVTRQVDGVTLRAALRLILRELDMTYIVTDEMLVLTTVEEAETRLVTQVYEVNDLTGYESSLVYRVPQGSGLDELLQLIETHIQPESWSAVGGPGSLSGHVVENTNTLVVNQTTLVHEQIERMLDRLREARSQSIADQSVGNDGEDVVVRVFPIKLDEGVPITEYATLVTTALESVDWDESSGVYVRPIANTLVVKHKPEIQHRIGQLLADIGVMTPPPSTQPAAGGGFGGGAGGGGGVRGGGGFGGGGLGGGGAAPGKGGIF